MYAISSALWSVNECSATIITVTKSSILPSSIPCSHAINVLIDGAAERITALFITVFAIVAAVVVGAIDAVLLNSRLFAEKGTLFIDSAYRANIAFFKALGIGILAPLGSIMSPHYIYSTLKARECLQRSITQVFVEIPVDLRAVAIDCHINLRAYSEQRIAKLFPNWRAELADELLKTEVHESPVRSIAPDLSAFTFTVFKPALLKVLARHLTRSEIRHVLGRPVIQTNPDILQQFKVIFHETLCKTRKKLMKERVYTSADIELMMGSSYQAMIDRALLSILKNTQKGDGSDFLILNSELEVTDKDFEFYFEFFDCFTLIKKLNANQYELLESLLNYEKDKENIEEARALDPSKVEDDLVKECFNMICALRTDYIDSGVLNKYVAVNQGVIDINRQVNFTNAFFGIE